MEFFGIFGVPLDELLVIFSIVVVIYLVILEFEFKQLSKLANEFDEEEIRLSKEMRELKEEIKELKGVIGDIKQE